MARRDTADLEGAVVSSAEEGEGVIRFSIDYDPSDGTVSIDVACRTKSRRELGTFIRAASAIRDHIAREQATLAREARKAKPLATVKEKVA